MKLYLNPHLFFLIKDGVMIVWDVKHHKQLEIEDAYIQRLKEISNTPAVESLSSIDQDLLSEGLIGTEPYEEIAWGWDDLSRIYHTGVQDIDGGQNLAEDVWVNEYMNLCDDIREDLQTIYYSREGEKVVLPDPNLSKLEEMSLWQSLKQRKTNRCFNGQSITLEELSTLLFSSFGLIHGEWKELMSHGFEEMGYRRSSPSGGALHPVEAYIFVFNVEGIRPGVYHYNVKGHFLTRVSTQVSYDELQQSLCGQFFVQGISVGVFLVGNFDKVWRKYGHSRSYRDVFLDAGHLSQTFLLSATAIGLRTWVTAWFRDSEISRILDISGYEHAPLFFLSIGHGENKAIPDQLEKIIKLT